MGVLKKGGAAAGRSRPGAGLEGLPLPVAGVTIVNMGVDPAGNHMFPGGVNGALCLRQTAGSRDQSEFSIFDAYISFPEAAFQKYQAVYDCEIQHSYHISFMKKLPICLDCSAGIEI